MQSFGNGLNRLVDVLVKHIVLPDVKSLLALCVDCVVAHHHQQQQQQVSGSIALLPVELQELITKELARKPGLTPLCVSCLFYACVRVCAVCVLFVLCVLCVLCAVWPRCR